MANISDDKAVLAYLLKQGLLADADAPIALMLKQAGVQTASGQCHLRFRKTCPSRTTIPLKVRIRQRKTSHYYLQKCAESEDLKTTFVIT